MMTSEFWKAISSTDSINGPSPVGGVSSMCTAEEDFRQAVVIGIFKWCEEYHILGTKTFQDCVKSDTYFNLIPWTLFTDGEKIWL